MENGKPQKSMVFNLDRKDLSRYLTERVPTWWLIVAAIDVTLRARRNFGGTLTFMRTVSTMILPPVA